MLIVEGITHYPAMWDLVSQGVLHVIKTCQISAWVSFAVSLHLDSQDILGDKSARPSFELTSHLNKLVRQHNKMAEWESPFLPDYINEDVYVKLGKTLENCQQWTSEVGFDREWKRMMQNPSVASHPVLKRCERKRTTF